MKTSRRSSLCQVRDLGLVDYERAWTLQKEAVAEVIAGGKDTLLLCEHPPVLTMGRLAKEDYILFSREELEKKRVKVFNVDRGGEVTLHAPGQLVIYPILNLANFGQDLKLFLRELEQVAIDLLQDFDIVASSFSGQRGVWVKDRKIASIGIGVRKWVTYHGMAINVNTDLDLFALIKPCGLDVKMTSIEAITGKKADLAAVKEKLVHSFAARFQLDLI